MIEKTELIKEYYEHRIKNGKEDYQIVGWESPEAQKARFDVLVRNIPFKGKKILDVGCGVGSLLGYLQSENAAGEYTGIDILPGMIEEARKRHPGARFIIGDVLSEKIFPSLSFDIIISSGLFNLNMGDNEGFLSEVFQKFCDLSRSTVALNLLHVRSPDREDKYYYYHPDEVKEMILRIAPDKPEVTIIEEYLPNDFTVICKKAGPG